MEKVIGKRLLLQDGNTVVITLMIMAILSVTGVYAISTSSTGLMATANYQTQKMAFANADAGVQYTLRKIREDLNNDIALENINPSDSTTYPIPAGCHFVIDPDGLPWTGTGPFRFTSTGRDGFGKGATFSVDVRFSTTEEIDDAFGYALLSDGDITISGTANIIGNIHSNRDVRQTGKGGVIDGNVTASGVANVDSADEDNVSSGVDREEVPKITDKQFEEWRNKADIILAPPDETKNVEGKTYFVYDQGDIDGDGDVDESDVEDLQGKIIYSDGNIVIVGHIMNGTIVAIGDILVQGSSRVDGSKIGTAMIAGGNITFYGSADSYGAFWANGSFEQKGSSSINGSIVAGGGGIVGDMINIKGSLTFTFSDQIENPNLPTEFKVRISSWADQALLTN